LLEYVHEPLLICRFVYPVVETNWYDIGIFAVIEVMTTQKCNNRAFGDQNHIPSRREAYEA
jgi:hypothetical protein